MAGKKETLELEVKTSGTKQAASAFKDVADSADKNLGAAEKTTKGFTAKIGSAIQGLAAKIPGVNKLIGPGLQDAALVGTGAIAGFAATAGAAVAKFAVDSVGKFQNLGVEIGKFADSTGVSTVEASKFVEVAKDLGIDSGTIEGAIGKMNKAIGTTPGVFSAAGIEIARTKDGTVDANQTFLNAVDALSAIQDPAQRATLAAKIFGKSYQGIAEVIFGGSEKIRKSFKAVSEEKLFTEEEVAKARRLRDAFDSFHDSIEDVQLSLGEALAPATADAAVSTAKLVKALEPLVGLFDPLIKGVGGFADVIGVVAGAADALVSHLGPVKDALGLVGTAGKDIARSFIDPIGAAKDLGGAVQDAGAKVANFFRGSDDHKKQTDDITKAQNAQAQQASALAQHYQELADAQASLDLETAAQQTQDLADANKNAADQSQRLASLAQAEADAINERIDAQHAATDSTFALEKANRDFGTSLGKTDKVLHDSKSSLTDMADAIDDSRSSAVGLSLAAVKLGQDQEKAKGGTLGAVAALDIQNQSLLKSAATAKGPVRDAIIAYINKLNEIPPEKQSEIKADIDHGRLAEANRKINEASRTRWMSINAQANTADALRKLRELINEARAARIEIANATGHNPDLTHGPFASGTQSAPAGVALVGERGPELVQLRGGERITPAPETARILAGGRASSTTTNVQIIMPAGANPREVAAAIRRTAKRNGS